MIKKILILLGNTDKESYSAALAESYKVGAMDSGYEVERVNISDLQFDPILHKGYKQIQPLEPDLLELQEKIKWADHLVIIYPNWWSAMPAILKGLFDRIWLPGFAFNFNKETKKIERHLKGKTARIIIISGSCSPFCAWWHYGDFTNEIQHGILGFSGIKAAVSAFGPCEKVCDEKKDKWLKQVEKMGKMGK